SRDMTSSTRIPRSISVIPISAWLLRAASSKNQPMKAIHSPPNPAPPKKRETRNHVESGKQKVDVTEPHQYRRCRVRRDRRRPSNQPGNPKTENSDNGARDGAGDRNPEFSPGIRRIFFDLRNSPKREQRDGANGQPVHPGD